MILKLLIFYMTLLVSHFVENRTVRLRGFYCTAIDDQYVEFNLCEVKPINRNTLEASVYAKILQKPIENGKLTLKLYKRGFEHLRPMYDMTIDVCAFWKNKRRNPIAFLLFQVFGFLQYSNMNHTCPYNHDLILHKYRWNDTYIQLLPLSDASYALHSNWTVSNKHRATISLYFQLLEK